MASSSSSSSSSSLSSAVSLQEKYDVFLSFRGEDTRKGFAGFLYADLSAKQISTFMDDRELERGDEISPTLRKAIEESKISIIIFSENYASSTWCLDELVQILECRRTRGQIVMPIFYRVVPSVVRKQEGSYRDAFADLEQRFKDRMEKLGQWRAALEEASYLCGLYSEEFSSEFKLVQRIVEDISSKLRKCLSLNLDMGHLVGIERKIEEIESLLSIGSKDGRIIGIWGMGGIGKTTLASVVFQRLSKSQFEGCSFLSNVREECARHGPNHLRKKLLSELLNIDHDILKMDTPFVASPYILGKLRRKKVLMVLDDVDSSIQLEALVERYDQLAPGSRIIVTTRNCQVLKKAAHDIYKVEGLSHSGSLELFRLHAFGRNSPLMDDEVLLEKVASYADGNPLALKVLGSFLNSKSKEEWESAINKLQKFPNKHILNVLRISYEGLDDEEIQNIFLDIACVFNQCFSRDHAERILGFHDSFVKIGISVLIDKCLIENDVFEAHNDLRMHDLLRQMGQTIVRDEHKEPGNRSRLWDAEDVGRILEKNEGTEMVEVISFNMSEISRDVKITCSAFSKMCNLRVLKIYCDDIFDTKFKLYLSRGLDFSYSYKLRYFQWDLYPLEMLPSNFNPGNLVELILRGSLVQKLWSHEVQSLPVLRRMDLSYSKLLTEIPDLSHVAPNLESLNLEGCTSLVRVLPLVENLEKLSYLNLEGCSKLGDLKETSRSTWYWDLVKSGGIKNFLSNICQQKLRFLKSFTNNILSVSSPGAHICQKFPMNLTILNLSGTPIDALPSSIGSLSGLVDLYLYDCKELKSLPTSIYKLKSLESLDLSGCVKLEKFPEILEPSEHLEIESLSNKLCDLTNLEYLRLEDCSKLERLPPLPPGLLMLEVDDCESLKSLANLPLFCRRVTARHCTSLEKISDWPAFQHELISSGFYEFPKYRRSVNFFGCRKLDQNTRNKIITYYAIFGMLEPDEPDFKMFSDFVIYYPGDEIPKWFSYQTSGSLLEINKLPPLSKNDNFLGLVICVVLGMSKITPASVSINFKLNFISNDGDRPCEFRSSRSFVPDIKDLDQQVIWYFPKGVWQKSCTLSDLNWPSNCSSEAFLHVWPSFHDYELREDVILGNEYCKIKKCGGTEMVEVISFNMSDISRDVKISRSAFSKMCNLRVLKIYCDRIFDTKFKLYLSQDLDSYLSDTLSYFQWDLYPLKLLPSNFNPGNLVELILRGSLVQKLWSHEVQSLPVLRRMDLSHSKLLTEIPDLSHVAPNLESLNLEGCTSLVQVLPFLENLEKLSYLNLGGCSKLGDLKEISRSTWYWDLVKSGGIKNFLSNICQQKLRFLKSFTNNILSVSSPGAHICQKFPMNLTILNLSGTPIDALPSSIGSLSGLVDLYLYDCKELKSLPTSIYKLKSLESLDLSGCVKLEKFPEILEPSEHLKIESISNKLCDLTNLECLWLEGCSKLERLPPLPPALLSLDVQDCESLKSLADLPLFCRSVNARHCTSLEKISDWPAYPHGLFPEYSRDVDFFGCGKLDQNTRNTIIADYAIFKMLESEISDLVFCYPGDEIPKWFSYQTSGSLLNIKKLPPLWNNDNFLGLAICVVLDLNKIKHPLDILINFKLNFITNDDDCPCEFRSHQVIETDRECLDQQVMRYFPKGLLQNSNKPSNLNWPSSCSSEASLHVWPSFHDFEEDDIFGNEYCKIKKCGVWLVNKEDLERLNAETIKSKRKRRGFDDECCEASVSDQFVSSGSREEEGDDESHPTISSKKFRLM